MKSSQSVTIGELAAEFELPTHVLRYWEAEGLLDPDRAANGRRRYGQQDRMRIAVVLLGKDAGLSLARIRELLAARPDRAARQEIYERHADELRRRIAEARASLAIIEHALECRSVDPLSCPGFQSKVEARLALTTTPR